MSQAGGNEVRWAKDASEFTKRMNERKGLIRMSVQDSFKFRIINGCNYFLVSILNLIFIWLIAYIYTLFISVYILTVEINSIAIRMFNTWG